MPIHKALLLIFSILVIASGCQQLPPENFGTATASDFDLSKAFLVDSFTVNTSTIQIDSITTGNIGYVQFGRYTHPEVGLVACTAVIGVKPNTSVNIEEIGEVDSVLFTAPIARIQGDTNQSVSFDIYWANQAPVISSDTVYKSLPLPNQPPLYDPKNLITTVEFGKTGFRTGGATNFTANLTNILGPIIKQNRDAFSTDNPDKFGKIIKGFVIVPKAGNLMVTNLMTNNVLKVVYRTPPPANEKKYYGLAASSASGHFTLISGDRSNTPFAALRKTGDKVPSTATNNISITQGGTGLRTLFTIPGLNNYLQALEKDGPISILKAELAIPVQRKDYGLSNFPGSYFLLEGSLIDRPSAFIFNDARRGEASGFSQFPYSYQDSTAYADISTYVQAVGRKTKNNLGILLYLSGSDISTYFLRIINQPNGRKVKLRVYYVRRPA